MVILTQPLGFRKKKDSLLSLMKLWYRNYPELVESMATRDRRYNETLDYIRCREVAGQLLVIRPPKKLPIGRTEKDPEKLRRVYNIGRQVAEARLEEIRNFLK